ncbi:hypothetical protein [Streptomyces sp. KL116D]|uniref:hypothetical protein n=1 Tax=Streptomyces sp. KL116D TaxID=3045152 RepID=UPI0035588CA7
MNTRSTDARTIASVSRAISAAGGSIVETYAKIGVFVVHSSNADFGKQIRATKGVATAGATRTAPLSLAGTTDEGAVQKLSGRREGRRRAGDARPGSRSRPTSGTCGRSALTRPRR